MHSHPNPKAFMPANGAHGLYPQPLAWSQNVATGMSSIMLTPSFDRYSSLSAAVANVPAGSCKRVVWCGALCCVVLCEAWVGKQGTWMRENNAHTHSRRAAWMHTLARTQHRTHMHASGGSIHGHNPTTNNRTNLDRSRR